jgi:hypothetical protein
MRKSFVIFQWLVLVGLIAGVLFAAFRTKPQPVYDPAAWKSWEGFYVLSYAGIVKKGAGNYVSPRQLQSQLRAVKKAGYLTIRLADALAFIQGRAPLPDKALLLLFEGDRKDSFLEATPWLEKLGFLGNLCVPTKLTHSWGGFFLKPGELEKVCRHPNWDLVSMGDRAIEQIPTDAAGTEGHFLSRRLWLADGKEQDQAFRQRLTADYARAAEILKGICGRQVIAYLYPFADAGTGVGADPLAADLNHQTVEAHHLLAFTRGDNPFNGPHSDRYHLARLRVSGEWDGRQLVAELAKYAPRDQAVTGIGGLESWQFVNGPQLEPGALALPVGSFAWLRGTSNWQDVDVRARFHLGPATRAAIYARHAGPHNYLRLTATAQEVTLQEHLDCVMQTLVRQPLKRATGQAIALRLRLKGNRAWVWVNGAPLIQGAPLTAVTSLGRVGVGAQEGQARLEDFAAAPLQDIFVLTKNYSNLPAALQESARAIIPPWFTLAAPPALDSQRRREVLLAAAGGVVTIPVLAAGAAETDAGLERWTQNLAAAVSPPELKSLLTTVAVSHGSPLLGTALEKQGFRSILIMTAHRALELPPEQWRQEKRLVLLDGPEAETRAALARALHFIPAQRLLVRLDAPGPLPHGVRLALKYKPLPEADP